MVLHATHFHIMEHCSSNTYDLKNVSYSQINVGNSHIFPVEIHKACLHVKGSEDLCYKETLLKAFPQIFSKCIRCSTDTLRHQHGNTAVNLLIHEYGWKNFFKMLLHRIW